MPAIPKLIRVYLHSFAVALVLLSAPYGSLAQPEEQKLKSFFNSYLDERFALRPIEATQLGDHRFDSRMEELTPAARAKWLEQTRKTLEELPKKVDYQKLSRAGQID